MSAHYTQINTTNTRHIINESISQYYERKQSKPTALCIALTSTIRCALIDMS